MATESMPALRARELAQNEVRLRTEKDRLRAALNVSARDTAEMMGLRPPGDSSLDDQLLDLEHYRQDALAVRLRDVDDALDRLRFGSYGDCLACGSPIGAWRLAADPAVALCRSCKEESEQDAELPTL